MKHVFRLSTLTVLLVAGLAVAASDKKDPHAGHAGHGDSALASRPASAPAASPATAQLPKPEVAEAEVRTINKEAGKITLKHGEIKNLDMGAMTMVFQVKEPALLDKVKVGDKVQFTAEKIRGQYTVTGIEKK